MNITVLDAYSFNPGDIGWADFERIGRLSAYDLSLPGEIPSRIQNADAVFTNRCRLGETAFAAAPNLKFVGLVATGYDKIDLAAARRHGIAVCNVPGYSTAAVAQHAFALLLDICNRPLSFDAQVRRGRWTQAPGDCVWDYPIVSLAGKTFGVAGTGAIGCAVAAVAKSFGMRILGYSRTKRTTFPGEYVSFDELLQKSDVLSLHLPSSPETAGIVGKQALAKMKPSAILINTARGALIDSHALSDALNAGMLYAAGLDVLEREPADPNDPLLTAKNCIITPHNGWASLAVRKELVRLAAENLSAFLNGTPINRVDLEVRR
jgi:glycerate dehydrogenase